MPFSTEILTRSSVSYVHYTELRVERFELCGWSRRPVANYMDYVIHDVRRSWSSRCQSLELQSLFVEILKQADNYTNSYDNSRNK